MPEKNSPLKKSLHDAGKASLRIFKQQRKRGLLPGIPVKQEVYTASNKSEFGAFQGGSCHPQTINIITRPMIEAVLWPSLENAPEFQSAVIEISKVLSKTKKKSPAKLVKTFCEILCWNVGKGQREKEALQDQVGVFIDEIRGEPFEWTVVVRLQGLFVKQKTLNLHSGLQFRQPTKEDLTISQFEGMPPMFNIMNFFFDSTMEIRVRAKYAGEAQRAVDHMLRHLRLYQPSCVHYFSEQIKTKSVMSFGGGLIGSGRRANRQPRLILGKKEGIAFGRFRRSLEKIEEFSTPPSGVETEVQMSLRRYEESLLFSSLPEERLTSAMMGLESIFIFKESGVQEKLSQRTAKLLSFVGLSPKDIYDAIKEGYHLRSRYLHGEILKKEEREKVSELLPVIWEALRSSILIFGILKASGETKKSTIKSIKMSLIDEDTSTEYKKQVQNLTMETFSAINHN